MIILDDVVAGTLVNAIALMGRQISLVMAGLRRTDDLTTARWFDTFRLTGNVPGQTELSPASRDRLVEILNSDQVQAGLQELLAARLTDAPETDASQARNVIRLTLTTADPDAARYAGALAEYYDDQICTLVARLQGEDPPLLAQIRSEAFSSRMINILHAIERHTAALTSRPDHRTEVSFLASYRRHVIDQHGKLEPPDFERRRRVPIASIYVPTIITEDFSLERTVALPPTGSSMDVLKLADMIDRSVLLGDPGGGKTTAANVLMHHFASEPMTARVPFFVTLREFAAQDLPERSVVGHIEHILETLYQCPPPPGLVDLLLLTARAIVIFDGLDELLDTSRRADVTTRVERFCAEYPLVPVLVTSRLVGYDQARLDDSQFSCYRLSGFGGEQVAEYVRKWFAQDIQARSDDVETFLAESDSVPDLRTNPLLLALLCILYRGAGSLPRNRAEVYEQCATLLYRKWDARRRIHQDLRAGHLLEPVLRHLAWLLFTRDDAQSVTEHGLILSATKFLHGRGFESEDEAREAAREFVEFCRGRMWVFSDAGTTATGEKLYAFTHRTFLEYFAAAQLAYDRDTPELLVDSLAPHVARNEWWVLAELAVQLKDRTSNGGARRIYGAMLGDLSRRAPQDRTNVLRFLAQCLRSIDPSPQRVRELACKIFLPAFPAHDETSLRMLFTNCGTYRDIVADEMEAMFTDKFRHSDEIIRMDAAYFFFSLLGAGLIPVSDPFWVSRVDCLIQMHAAPVTLAAQTDGYVRSLALRRKVFTTKQALEMPGGLTMLFRNFDSFFPNSGTPPYLTFAYNALMSGWPKSARDNSYIADFEAIGEYLCHHPELPWVDVVIGRLSGHRIVFIDDHMDDASTAQAIEPIQFRPIVYLGAAAVLAIVAESSQAVISDRDLRPLDFLKNLGPYFRNRFALDQSAKLPELPVPDEFKQIFRDWAKGRVSFTGGLIVD